MYIYIHIYIYVYTDVSISPSLSLKWPFVGSTGPMSLHLGSAKLRNALQEFLHAHVLLGRGDQDGSGAAAPLKMLTFFPVLNVRFYSNAWDDWDMYENMDYIWGWFMEWSNGMIFQSYYGSLSPVPGIFVIDLGSFSHSWRPNLGDPPLWSFPFRHDGVHPCSSSISNDGIFPKKKRPFRRTPMDPHGYG